jgi:hypothetical protein
MDEAIETRLTTTLRVAQTWPKDIQSGPEADQVSA